MIDVQQHEHVLEIAVRRAEKRNALSLDMYHQLARAMFELDQKPELWVGLIYAEGPHFTAGVDLNDWARVFASGERPTLGPGELDPFGLNGPCVRKPLVMAVQGYCYTWGTELLLATDLRVAATDTRFAMLEVKRGFFACGGATLRLPTAMGWAKAQRYLLTGEEWFAEEAWQTGLVGELCAPGEQLERARAMAAAVCQAAPLGVQASLKSSRQAADEGVATAYPKMFPDLAKIMQSADAAEGVASFKERRSAQFKGN